jgi:hypothetical protein
MPEHHFYPEVRPVQPPADQQAMNLILFLCALLSVSSAVFTLFRFFWMLP